MRSERYASEPTPVPKRYTGRFFAGTEVNKTRSHGHPYASTLLRKRLFAVLLATAFLFLLVFARFFWVQILDGEKLRALALEQWTREIPVIASRDRIVDTNGVVLADNRSSYTVFVRPNAVEDMQATAFTLADTEHGRFEVCIPTTGLHTVYDALAASGIPYRKRCRALSRTTACT